MKNKLLYILIFILCLAGCTDETKVQSVRLNPTEITLNIGETRQIEMLIEPISAIIYNPVAWRTSDPNVAQVDNKGNITATYAGECLITCKTKHHEAYCRVTVVSPKYQLTFPNAILFDEGIKAETNQRNLILRLYDNNLSIDSTGTMSGNGLFLNINLYAPANSQHLPSGEYQTTDSINDYTIMPGSIRQETNTYYATGSYLGQYTDNGLSVIFIKNGNINIENNSNYKITCSLIGTAEEEINAIFEGPLNIYDTSSENQIRTFEYTNAKHESVEINNEPTLNHIKISLSNNDTSIVFVARTPKSISTLPTGTYYLSYDAMAYTLLPDSSAIITSGKTTTITTATLQVQKNEYYGSITDGYGNKYLLRTANKYKNIRKQQIKSFVY